ncbi:MAG: hypothetical protein AAGJ35_01095 [Myxococcota bacterium]
MAVKIPNKFQQTNKLASLATNSKAAQENQQLQNTHRARKGEETASRGEVEQVINELLAEAGVETEPNESEANEHGDPDGSGGGDGGRGDRGSDSNQQSQKDGAQFAQGSEDEDMELAGLLLGTLEKNNLANPQAATIALNMSRNSKLKGSQAQRVLIALSDLIGSGNLSQSLTRAQQSSKLIQANHVNSTGTSLKLTPEKRFGVLDVEFGCSCSSDELHSVSREGEIPQALRWLDFGPKSNRSPLSFT